MAVRGGDLFFFLLRRYQVVSSEVDGGGELVTIWRSYGKSSTLNGGQEKKKGRESNEERRGCCHKTIYGRENGLICEWWLWVAQATVVRG
ncbi:conserved hypothetical protein [Ricinus communis]|uniref:Uncharacterized protein n=1 Tax=Ricinus communis TaxID=3988 RepID=B9RDV9_RICCO|nr:conserved hypothetical protein [Ricinus communis]